MKIEAKKIISMTRSFWGNPILELSYLYEIKTFTDQIKAI
jgi:hypothetical protein